MVFLGQSVMGSNMRKYEAIDPFLLITSFRNINYHTLLLIGSHCLPYKYYHYILLQNTTHYCMFLHPNSNYCPPSLILHTLRTKPARADTDTDTHTQTQTHTHTHTHSKVCLAVLLTRLGLVTSRLHHDSIAHVPALRSGSRPARPGPAQS